MSPSDDPPDLVTGDPRARGRALAALGAAQGASVRERALDAHASAGSSRDWLASQWQAQRAHLPEIAGVVEGMAEGFALPVEALFAAHLRYAIEDRRRALSGDDAEGCSVFAIARAAGGALLAKNRDNRAYFRPLQMLVRQRDPVWGGREILCVGSFGSIPSASSGINSDGFCMADTAVRTRDLGIGVLRYYLMEALLARCGSVPEALALIGALPHVGGGNLVLADRSGAIAAVELGHSAVRVWHPGDAGWLARTNHFLAPELARGLTESPGCAARENSESRLSGLTAALAAGPRNWGVGACQALLAEHGEARDHAPLCRHGEDVATNSGAVFEAATGTLHLSRGYPCGGAWRRARLS